MVSLSEKIIRSIQILLVEDNLGDVTLILEAFKGSKHPVRVTRAKDGEEALRFLRGKGGPDAGYRPDIILLDLNMPRKSGFEVLGEIKGDPRLREIPVVVLTNSKLQDDVRRAYESNANFYIVKPTDLDQLFVAMRYVEDIWLAGVGKVPD
jgi:two-component system, chemotaxis family, response regulator Rcp1